MTRDEILRAVKLKNGEDYNSYADRAVPLLQGFNKGRTYGLTKAFVEDCRNRICEVIMEQISKICSNHYRLCKEYIDFNDFCSESYTKVLCRVNEYDPKQGKFSTFIKNDIIAAKREILESSNNTTHYEYKNNKIITDKAFELASIQDRSPELVRDEDIAFALKNEGITLKKVKKYRNISINKNAIRIDDDICNLTNKIADKDAYNLAYVDDLEDSFKLMLRCFDDIDLLLFLIMYDSAYNLSREEVMNTDLYRMMYSKLHPTSKKACRDNKPVYEKHVTHINSELARYGKGIARLYSIEEFNECLMHFIEKTRCEIVDYLNNKYY